MGLRRMVRDWILKGASDAAVVRNIGTGSGIVPVPDDPAALLEQYRGWVYACVTKNAEGVSAVPLRLYVRKTRKGASDRTVGHYGTPTRQLKRYELDRLSSKTWLTK